MSIPSAASRKNCQNGTLDMQNRSRNADTDTGFGLCNGSCKTRMSLAGNSCHRVVSDMGSSATSVDESRSEQEQLHLISRNTAQSSENGESGGTQAAECNGHHAPFEGSLEEEDAVASEIVEFFSAFQDGQEHFMKYIEKSKSPESLSEPRGNRLGGGAIQKTASVDGQSSSNKLGPHPDEDDSNCGIYRSTGRSGKWSSYLEVDSFSATFSGPLPFSGPIAYSGHSGHVLYSGSVSHRSDSSSASTHSFAFPILPCEWNSSPVKMAQPDTRYTQKRWKRNLCSFFCCATSPSGFE